MTVAADVRLLRLLSDQPEVEADALWDGLTGFARAVGSALQTLPDDSPVLITGPWGAGKTTFLRALQRQIDPDPQAKPRTVWFEAWRCEAEGALLPAMIRSVWEAAAPNVKDRETLVRAFRMALFVALRGARFAAAAFGQKDVAEAAETLDPKGLKEDWDALLSLGERAPDRDPLRELHERFASLIEVGWPGASADPAKRPVIFVDDLDRCSPEKAVALIEQIRSIVALGHELPCRFIVAMDREVLVRAISAKFASIGSYDGNRYLEKVFPLAFSLPVPEKNATGHMVRKLLKRQRGAAAQLAAAEQRESDGWHEALSTALGEAHFANPRLIKRCINRFAFIKHFERTAGMTVEDAQGGDDADIVLAKWLAATERWPALRRLIQQRRDEWQRIEQALMGQASGPLGPDAEAVLNERGGSPWLRAEIFAGNNASLSRYQGAELRLRRWGL
jgi:hypothetical protein